MSMRVPYFNYPYLFSSDEKELLRVITDVCRRGAFILQEELASFEANLATFTGAKYALGVGNATDGLTIALKAAGIKTGDEVIFCSHTFVATASAVHMAGAIPVPCECGPDRLIDPQSAAQAITPRTRAILPTQLNGRVCDMDALRELADQHDLLIIEDAAQALGAKFKGQCSGTFGVAGAFSFYPAKSLGCFGDGGAILTNDPECFEKMRMLRDHGKNREGIVSCFGYNSRLDNLQAAILDYRLKTFDSVINRRRQLAALYHQELSTLSALGLPPPPDNDGDRFDTYQNYEIEADDRDGLRSHLAERGIGTLTQWGGKAVHQFEGLGFKVKLPYTERFFERCLMLPMNVSLSDEDVLFVCETVRSYYK